MASVLALSAFGPGMLRRMQEATLGVLSLVSTPEVVSREGVGELFVAAGGHIAMSTVPVVAVCMVAGVLASVGQVGFKPTPKALWEVKKLNPLTGFKNIFGVNAAFEGVKSTLKVVAVGGIVALAVFPKLDEMAALVGMPAAALLPHLVLADPPDRPAGRARLPGDRGDRPRLSAPSLRQAAEDGQGGDQAGAQGPGAAVGDQGRSAAARDGARRAPA